MFCVVTSFYQIFVRYAHLFYFLALSVGHPNIYYRTKQKSICDADASVKANKGRKDGACAVRESALRFAAAAGSAKPFSSKLPRLPSSLEPIARQRFDFGDCFVCFCALCPLAGRITKTKEHLRCRCSFVLVTRTGIEPMLLP